MDKIGIAITGRNPGYTVFVKINWFGEEPLDQSMRSLCKDDTYVSAVLGTQYDTYTLAICNFQAIDGRGAEFHIELRLPHGYAIVKNGGTETAVAVLRGVREIIEEGALLQFTGYYVLNQRPNFQEAKIAALIDSYVVKPAWNKYITMADDSVGDPCYVATNDSNVSTQLQALLHNKQMSNVSRAYFGQFSEVCGPVYTFPQETELGVRVQVYRKDGNIENLDLPAGERRAEFRSTDYGYDQIAYKQVSCCLSSAEVLKAYYRGEPLTFMGGYVELDLAVPAVKVRFNPPKEERVYIVSYRLVDKTGQHPFSISDLRCKLQTGVLSPINPIGYKYSGEEILNFERQMQNSSVLKGEFDVCNKDFKIVGALLSGTKIEVSVEYVNQHRVAPPPIATGIKSVVAATTILHITVPAALGRYREVVVVQVIDDGNKSVTITDELDFKDNGGAYVADMQIPATLAKETTFTVQLGEIARAITHTTQSKGECYANFAECKKYGAFGRYCQLFSYANDMTLSVGSKCKRWLTLVAIAVILLVLGFLAGIIVSDIIVKNKMHLFGDTLLAPTAVEDTATPATVEDMPVLPLEEKMDQDTIGGTETIATGDKDAQENTDQNSKGR